MYGIHQTRVNSAVVQRSVDEPVITSSRECKLCCHSMSNAGTAWYVTSVIIPKAPRLTSAARKSSVFSSAEHDVVRPSASIILSPKTDCESKPCRVELPCVAVPIAPAMAWLSILPRFDIASPCFLSSAPKSCSRIPASITTTLFSSSIEIIRLY